MKIEQQDLFSTEKRRGRKPTTNKKTNTQVQREYRERMKNQKIDTFVSDEAFQFFVHYAKAFKSKRQAIENLILEEKKKFDILKNLVGDKNEN